MASRRATDRSQGHRGGAFPGQDLGTDIEARQEAVAALDDQRLLDYGMIRLPERRRRTDRSEPLDDLRRPGATPTLAIIGERAPYPPAPDVVGSRTSRR